MKVNRGLLIRMALLGSLTLVISLLSSRMRADTGICGGQTIVLPFVDVGASTFFCQIAEAFYSGLTNGTDATHFSPSANVPREQMSAFVTRTLDQSTTRAKKRAALDQFWNTGTANNLGLTDVGDGPAMVKSDGADVWVANPGSATVSRVRASDGKLLETWTGAVNGFAVLVAMGKVFITNNANPGGLYQIDPTQTPGAVTAVASNLGINPAGIAYDGQRIWTANVGFPGSVSIITLNPVSVITVSIGFFQPIGIVYNGFNIWVTDENDNKLKKLNSDGTIALSVNVGSTPRSAAFDGTNIWVANQESNSVSVVRATGSLEGTLLATLTGNGLDFPQQTAFDGERILVTSFGGNKVALWKASDLTPIGAFDTGAGTWPNGVCSDGLNFWVTLSGADKLARY